MGYGVVDRTNKDRAEASWNWAPTWGWRYYRWGVAWPADFQQDLSSYTDGTVVVYLVSAQTHRVVWQGRAPDVVLLPPGDEVHARQQIDGAVASLFTKFPPASRG